MAAQSTHPEGSRLRGLMAACQSVIEISPLPMALIEGFDAVLRCINPAFCNLAGERMQDLLGRRASVAVPVGKEFLRDLRETLVSGESCTRVGDRSGDHSSPFNAYAMWPVLGPGNSATAVMIQIIDSGHARDGVDGNRTIRADTSRQKRMAEGLEERLSAEVEEKKKALEALVQSEKLASLGRMAASIAHEINNPLETVTNLIYLTRSIPDLPENARQFLDIADSELTRIAEITRQSLGFYRESAIPETFSLALLLDSVGHLLVSRIKSSHATVACEADENLRITAHSGEMRQVLSNLLLNSLDAVGVGGRVRLRARLHLDSVSRLPFVRITISDNGAGIDATALPHIFEPFFTTKGSAGNGLGLWVSREIVRKNGGWMRVRSATNGARKGTTFSVVMTAIPN